MSRNIISFLRARKNAEVEGAPRGKGKNLVIYIVIIALLLVAGVVGIALALGMGADRGQLAQHSPTPHNIPVITPIPTTTPAPTEIPIIENSIEPSCGMVLAGDKLSFGLASNGKLSYIGSNNGQAYCFDWSDITAICGNAGFTAGLKKDGTVLVSGREEIKQTVADWSEVVSITASDTELYALREDGTVYSTDGSADGLECIIAISAGSDFMVAIVGDGQLVGIGNAPDLSEWADMRPVQLACGADFVCILTAEGEFFTTGDGETFAEVDSAGRIFACGSYTAIIDKNGVLHTDCELIEEEIEEAIWFSYGFEHGLVLLDDGTVRSFGDNEYMQCETANWRLRPYITEDGYILGLTVGEVREDGSLVKTGDSYTLENGTEGTAVILGDVDTDGAITDNDLYLLERHLKGLEDFTSLQKYAANLLRDDKKPDAVDNADAEQLKYHLDGFTMIDQYAKEFIYSGELADAERINRDAMGYIRLEGTNIESAVMYGDNFYYHYHNTAGAATSRGSIYLYYPKPTKNTVITGHNLRVAGIMLHELHKIQDKYAQDYDVFKNRIWTVNVYGETHYWEVFAMYEEKPSNPSESSQYYNCNFDYTMDVLTDEEIQTWIEYQVERTELDYTIHVTPDDRFMTVLTCADAHWESNQGGRIYFFLRRMDGN